VADPTFRDDAGDVAVRGDVERGIPDPRALRRHARRTEVADLALIAFLDRNVRAVRRRDVDRRHGRRDVKRDVVLPREHGDRVGADLVRDISVRGDPIGAHDGEIDLAIAHERSGHAFGDDGGLDALAHELPGRQPCALQERARLVGEDRNPFSVLDRRAKHAKRGAIPRGGERAGVAVRQDTGAVRHDCRAVLAHGPAVRDVLVVNPPRLALQALADFFG
jgi:hypothetical protein